MTVNKDQHPNADDAFEPEFMTWWEKHGQYCRSGGGDYERSFAFEAWRHLYPKLMQARAARSAPHADGMADAYVGAREDLAIWKHRALEAEQKVRVLDQRIDQLVLEAQGETRMGEPHIDPPAAVPAELTNVRCMCGDEYPHDSYGAGFIAGSGMCENCDAAIPAKEPPAAGVPEGWKLAPLKPTIEMVEAGYEASLGQPDRSAHARVIEQYDAMLAEAPTPPASEQQRAVVMPARTFSTDQGPKSMAFSRGFNACLNEFLRLNPHLAKGEGV